MECILTVLGKDKPGIIAKVSTKLAEHNINIEDISQTILQDTFTMIMSIDLEKGNISLAELKREMQELGDSIGVSIHLQHKEIFDIMHNV